VISGWNPSWWNGFGKPTACTRLADHEHQLRFGAHAGLADGPPDRPFHPGHRQVRPTDGTWSREQVPRNHSDPDLRVDARLAPDLMLMFLGSGTRWAQSCDGWQVWVLPGGERMRGGEVAISRECQTKIGGCHAGLPGLPRAETTAKAGDCRF
jgi:hypothetical protein